MIWISFLIGSLAIACSVCLVFRLDRIKVESAEASALAELIDRGGRMFFARQWLALALAAAVISLMILIWADYQQAVLFFLAGLAVVGLAGWFSLSVASRTSIRSAEAAQHNFQKSFQIALTGGQAVSLLVLGAGLVGLAAIHLLAAEPFLLLYYVFGAALAAFGLRLAGGIYTKSADIGADLIGKMEQGVPEDDPRNPALVADQVGDQVGDLVGTSVDLLESYLSSVAAAMILGWLTLGAAGLVFPLWLAGLSLLTSLIGSLIVRLPDSGETDLAREAKNIKWIIRRGKVLAAGLFLVGAAVLTVRFLPDWRYFLPVLIGLVAGAAIGGLSHYGTASGSRPVKRTIEAGRKGAAAVVSEGIRSGFFEVFLPALIVAVSIALAYFWGEFYGIALAAVGVLGTLAIELMIDGFGPMADNAGGLVQSAKLGAEARRRTEVLDAIGNSVAAVGKSFAITAAAFTVLAWLSIYFRLMVAESITFLSSHVLAGLFFGGSLVFVFCALVMNSVNSGAVRLAEEARRQFHETEGLKEGVTPPDHQALISLATGHALRGLIWPAVLVLVFPLLAGWWLGAEAMGGILAGSLAAAFPLAVFMACSGAVWDNAKKQVEADNPGSPEHQALIVGDLVGDPLKDAVAPALNIFIKLMGVVTLIFVFLFV